MVSKLFLMKYVFSFILLSHFSFALASSACNSEQATQASATQCTQEKSQDFKLIFEQLVEKLTRTLPPRQQQYFIAAQADWQKMTDNDCSIVSHQLQGGSARSMMVSLCYLGHRKQRLNQIRNFLCGPMVYECEAAAEYDYLFGTD
jgi:uncharacterized protein YecT (DUF1311 family)